MVYCSACGTQNEEDATFCKKCGFNLQAGPRGMVPGPRGTVPYSRGRQDCDEDCDRECYGDRRGKSFFWGLIIILVGSWIIFNFVIKEVVDLPKWIEDMNFWWIFAIIVGAALIAAGLRSIMGPKDQ